MIRATLEILQGQAKLELWLLLAAVLSDSWMLSKPKNFFRILPFRKPAPCGFH